MSYTSSESLASISSTPKKKTTPRPQEKRKCEWCNKPFMAGKNSLTKTCSPECAYKRLAKKQADKYIAKRKALKSEKKD